MKKIIYCLLISILLIISSCKKDDSNPVNDPGNTNSQNFWLQTNGPVGGDAIMSLAINSQGHIFASPQFGGIFKSTDNGNTWVKVFTNQSYALAINPINDNIFSVGQNSGGLYRSSDNGNTWIQIGASYNVPIAISNDGNVFILGFNGCIRSTDNGNTWQSKNNGLPTTSFALESIAINSLGHIYIGTDHNGIFRSTNNGENWYKINNGLDTTKSVISLSTNNTNEVLASIEFSGVYISTNNGNSWSLINNGLTSSRITRMLFNNLGHIFAVGRGYNDYGVFRSTNKGTNWTLTNSGLIENHVISIAINADGYLFAGTEGGTERARVYRSVNSTTK